MLSRTDYRLLLSVFLVVTSLCPTSALRTPFNVQRRGGSPHSTNVQFNSKQSTNGDSFDFANINTVNAINVIYVADLFIGGKSFEVQLDTGSSDLWIDTTGLDLSAFQSTGQSTGISYGDGTVAAGSIVLATAKFGNFTVDKQAFISAPGTNATTSGDKGLLGVGPAGLSAINNKLINTTFKGFPLLDNIFSIYPEEPNFITFLLSRSLVGRTDGGIFAIGEVDQKYSDVSKQPKNSVFATTSRWIIATDYVVINGQNVSGGSQFTTLGNKTASLLDTGGSGSQAPKAYVDAMYGSIPGASFDSGTYTVPCNSKVEITYVMSGVEYAVDPLDAIQPLLDSTGKLRCVGTWSYSEAGGPTDTILGDPFLRNVYALYDFGSLTPVGKDTEPFIQLLSVTDAKQASTNFDSLNSARLAQVAKIQSSGTITNTSPSPTSSGVEPKNDVKDSTGSSSLLSTDLGITPSQASELIRNSYIILGFLAAVIALLVALTFLSLRKGKGAYQRVTHVNMIGGEDQPFTKGHKYQSVYNLQG